MRANLPRLKYWLDQAYLNGGSVVKPAESGAIDKQEATPIKDKNSEPVNDSGTDNSPSDQPVSSDNSADDSSGSNTAENTPTDQSGDNGSAATNTDSNAGASTNPTLNNTRVLPYVVGLEAISSRYNLEPGNSATLTANAVYNNGNKVDVTKEVSWSLSPDDVTGEYVGALRGNIFIANQNMGKAYITAVYQAPDAKRYTDDLELTVFVLKPITNAR